MRLLLSFLLILATQLPVHAWDDGGHMLVALIAHSQLRPEVRKQADELLTHLVNADAPTQKYSFATAACWMDDVRRVVGKEGLRNLHFINRTCEGHDPQAPHALSALKEFEAKLTDKNAAATERAEALACLMHVVGDIHQPLHAIDRDRGGNDFPVSGVPELWLNLAENGQPVTETNPGKYQRLHAFWDFAYRYDVPPAARPEIKLMYGAGNSANPNVKRLEAEAKSLMRFLPDNNALLAETDAGKWVAESNALACNFAFETPRGATPSHEYVKRANLEASRRVVLAGYRLGALLNRVFGAARAGG